MKKQTKSIFDVSITGAASSIGIAGIGGSAASVAGATGFLPAMGTMVGAGGLIRTIQKGFPTKKRKKK